jgi:hypothetical protein
MAKNTDQLARSFEAENTGGLLSGFLAEEDELDRNALWRLGSWGAASVGAVIVALLASQSSIGLRRGEVAAADLVRQSRKSRRSPRKARTKRGGWPPRSIPSTAIATGCTPGSPFWNRIP